MRTTTFGVELEFLPQVNRVRRDVRRVIPQPIIPYRSSATQWGMHSEEMGLEVTTPALNWRTWPRAKRVIAAIQAVPTVSTDAGNGLHVHFGVRKMGKRHLRNLLHYWATYEAVIFQLVRANRRNNWFCAPIARSVLSGRAFSTDPWAYDHCLSDKYNALNVAKAWYTAGRRDLAYSGTIEVRLHHGTLDPDEIESWIILMQQTINVGMNTKEAMKQVCANTQGFERFIGSLQDVECRDIVRARRRCYSY